MRLIDVVLLTVGAMFMIWRLYDKENRRQRAANAPSLEDIKICTEEDLFKVCDSLHDATADDIRYNQAAQTLDIVFTDRIGLRDHPAVRSVFHLDGVQSFRRKDVNWKVNSFDELEKAGSEYRLIFHTGEIITIAVQHLHAVI